MQKEIMNQEEPAISPEALEVANCYMQTLSVDQTARALDLSKEVVTSFINTREVKQYIDTIFLDQGYMNRYKIQDTLEKIIDAKLEECNESEMYSNKDIADLLLLAHKMRMEEIKAMSSSETTIGKQVNIQNNSYGDNHNELLDRIIRGK